MKNVLRKLWNDDNGFVVTVELILVATILVIGLVTGFAMLRDAVLAELSDTAMAFGSIDQSWTMGGALYDPVASTAGSEFVDLADGSDVLGDPVDAISGAGIAGITITPSTIGDVSAFVAEGS